MKMLKLLSNLKNVPYCLMFTLQHSCFLENKLIIYVPTISINFNTWSCTLELASQIVDRVICFSGQLVDTEIESVEAMQFIGKVVLLSYQSFD